MNILADVLSATILFAVPLLLVALGGMFSERSGIINLALEGIMIVGALLGCHVLRWLDPSVQTGAMHGQVAVLISASRASSSRCCWPSPPSTSRRIRPSVVPR